MPPIQNTSQTTREIEDKLKQSYTPTCTTPHLISFDFAKHQKQRYTDGISGTKLGCKASHNQKLLYFNSSQLKQLGLLATVLEVG